MKEKRTEALPGKKPAAKKTKPNTQAADESAQQLFEVMSHLKPLADFHQSLEEAGENDLRLFWDVRLVKGKDTPFCHVKGTSSLPAMLASNMIAEAPSKIQCEITDKIMKPLVAAMQSAATRRCMENYPKKGGDTESISEEECFGTKGDDPSIPGMTSSASNPAPHPVE